MVNEEAFPLHASSSTLRDGCDWEVRAIMTRFRTGPYATAYHLKNRRFIDEERRARIVAELVA